MSQLFLVACFVVVNIKMSLETPSLVDLLIRFVNMQCVNRLGSVRSIKSGCESVAKQLRNSLCYLFYKTVCGCVCLFVCLLPHISVNRT